MSKIPARCRGGPSFGSRILPDPIVNSYDLGDSVEVLVSIARFNPTAFKRYSAHARHYLRRTALSELQTARRAQEKTGTDEAIRQSKCATYPGRGRARTSDTRSMLDEASAAGKAIVPIDQVLHNLPDPRFVFSTEEIDRKILRRARRLAVSIAEQADFDYEEYLERVA